MNKSFITTGKAFSHPEKIHINMRSLMETFSIRGKNEQNKQWYKDMYVYYKNYGLNDRWYEDQAKIDICYDIFNGLGWKSSRRVNSLALKKIKDENLLIPRNVKFRHFPILTPVLTHRIGLRKSKPLKGIVIDTSGYGINTAKMAINAKIANFLNENIVMPMVQNIQQMELQSMGVTDPFQLSPEARQELQLQVEQKKKENIPELIFDKFVKDYKSPLEEEGALFFEWLKHECNLNYLIPEGYKHMLVGGKCGVYKIDIKNNNKVSVRICHPRNHRALFTANQLFYEDAEVNIYEDTISPVEFYTEYYDKLNKEDRDKVNAIHSEWRPHGHLDDLQGKYIGSLDVHGHFTQDTRTPEGMQNWIKHLGNLGYMRSDAFGVTRTTAQLRGTRYLKQVLNQDPKTGQASLYYIDEAYELDKKIGDIKYEFVKVPEVYNIEELGTGVYVNMGPVPFQYNNIDDPWEVKSQFFGSPASRIAGDDSYGWPMLRGLNYQYASDMHMTLLDKDISKNMGTVLQMITKAIPSGMSPREFGNTLRNDSLLLVDYEGMGITPDILNSIRAINLNNAVDIAARREHMAELRQMATLALHYNDALLGQQGQYQADRSVQSAIEMANMQILDEEQLQDKVEENLCNGLLRIAQQVYRNNPPKSRLVTPDGSIVTVDFTDSEIYQAALQVKVTYSYESIQDLERLRQAIVEQSFKIPGYLEPDEFTEVFLTKSKARLQNIMKKASERRKQQQQAEQQMQQQMQQQVLQAKAEEAVNKQIHEDSMLEKRLATDRYKAEVQSETMQKGFDVDQDGIDNMTEAKDIEMKAKERMHKITELVKLAEKELALQAIKEKPKAK